MIDKNFIAIIKKNWKTWVIYAILVSNILLQVIKVMGYAFEHHYILFEFRGILNDLDSSMYEMGINNVKLIYGWLCRDALLNTCFAIFAFIVYRHAKAKTAKQ
ncbi:MAG: hypothetical protein J6S09_07090 [Paludibacteraceae bacterium]|nr:hypothetical protein [Paludibacteraceae bacterium]